MLWCIGPIQIGGDCPIGTKSGVPSSKSTLSTYHQKPFMEYQRWKLSMHNYNRKGMFSAAAAAAS